MPQKTEGKNKSKKRDVPQHRSSDKYDHINRKREDNSYSKKRENLILWKNKTSCREETDNHEWPRERMFEKISSSLTKIRQESSTIGRNSHIIQGDAADLTVSTERAAFRLVYVDATQGWLLDHK